MAKNYHFVNNVNKIGLNVQNLRKLNISILIFISTCKQVTQSEPMEFSKNNVFHS